MCKSGDQCYRYWDHCDNEEHCDDGSDEGGACKARYVQACKVRFANVRTADMRKLYVHRLCDISNVMFTADLPSSYFQKLCRFVF